MLNIRHLRSLAIGSLLLLSPAGALAQTAITWESVVNATINGTQVSKTNPEDNDTWTDSAISAQSIPVGGGEFRFTVDAPGGFRVGLSNDPAVNNTPSHYWYFFFDIGPDNASVRVPGDGGWVYTESQDIGSVYALAVDANGTVTFKKDGANVYVSTTPVSLPVKLDVAFQVAGSAFSAAQLVTTGGGGDPEPPPGSTVTVCASGCTFTDIQSAINAVTPGSVVILEDNRYWPHIELPAKTCAANNATCYITVRSGVSSTGVLRDTAQYPVPNQRICPSSRSDCASKNPFDTARLAKIRPTLNNVPAIKMIATGASANTNKWWRFQWIEVAANSYGGNALIVLSNDTAQLAAHIPSEVIFDQVVVRGDPLTGQFRGTQIDANGVTIQNSYFYDIKSLGEGQVIWANTSRGRITLTNNYLSGGAETLLTGGGGTGAVTEKVIQDSPTPTRTAFTLNSVVDLYVGLDILVNEKSTQITAINGNGITVSPALPFTPVAGMIVDYSIVIDGMIVNKNTFTRPIEWYTQQVIIPQTTSGITATPSTTGGTLAAGTYYYRVAAFYPTSMDLVARQRASVDVSATTTGSTGKVTISWPAVPNATGYRIYGRQATNESLRTPSQYWEVTGNGTTTFVDTGANGTSHGWDQDTFVAAMFGSKWQVKNTFELKQGMNVLLEGNIIENSWPPGQVGQCIVLTGTMQMRDAPSAVIRNFTARYNVMRKCQQSLMISGRDALGQESGRSGNFTFHDNLFYDMGNMGDVAGSTYWQGTMFTHGGESRQAPDRMPYNFTFNHNTIHSVGNQQGSVLTFNPWDGAVHNLIPNLIVTNNLAYGGQYGVWVVTSAGYTMGAIAQTAGTGSLFSTNVFAGAPSCGSYTGVVSIICPSVASIESDTWTGSMGDGLAISDFVVKNTSPFYNTALDAKPYGADISLITPLYAVADSGNNTGTTPPPTVLDITTTSPLPPGYVGQAYSFSMAANGGTAPYTWAITNGTIPAGLTLDTATGVISGTPTTAVTDRALTFRVTDATSAQVSELKTISIIRLRVRPGSIGYTYNKGINFGPLAVAPTNPQYGVKVGDTYFDTTTGKMMVATTATSTSVTWAVVGG